MRGAMLAMVIAAASMGSAAAQTPSARLVCEGRFTLYDSGATYDWSGAIVTVSDGTIAIQNMPSFSETWPIYRTTDAMLYIMSDTTEGGQVQGNLNRLSGDLVLLALTRPIGQPGARGEMEFNGRCAMARRMF